jgi:hypothetical protein
MLKLFVTMYVTLNSLYLHSTLQSNFKPTIATKSQK